MDEKEKFKDKFYELDNLVKTKYFKEDESKELLGHLINNFLDSVKLDINTMPFIEFYKKYLKGTLYCGYEDFTNEQIEEIIKQARLSDENKMLARLYYIEVVSENKISEMLGYDIRTIRSRIPNISVELKLACIKIYT